MAIMQSCCCWRSVRRGSFACAIYSGIYFTVLALTTGKVLQGESQYLRGNRSLPESTSFLEPDTISPTTVRFNVTLLICSCCGVICSILLLYGLCKDQRVFLIPWIIVIVTICFIDVGHSLYLFIAASTFDPTKVMLYTLNFFLLCLNIYSVLCVISQYQEYMAGRGTIADDYEYRVPAVRYAIQPPTTTATSCLSSRRAPTNNETKATATPTQSPTTGQNTLSLEKSPVTARPSRKHVQFPDTAPDSQNGKSEVPITMLVLQMEAENEHATSSTSLKLEEATIDQVLLSQKNSYSQHT
ncbi:uncharacterized protein LOC117153592 isoform X2 [Bombus vancouverensis nearcticus]|uniref:Uncharacterized protein LOC117204481 isoform X2 n=1 Tax=Bombus bifarius TaxID=103933 RepID=A0A6P8LHU3_9HYME|nr:uncharacterized protein LOC117153592 isoform X2 [Bombus vancouverensis nearcticus]XP_033297809.1 uncharacterized protein LOC117204481 isoform X2 [Bombus bifarius]XP_050477502.1 uncharacterized protein LOC126867264 isoform X2 [Bombus huntii]